MNLIKIFDSKTLLSEKPLLLNPEYDNPDDHLDFNNVGEIIPKEESRKGEETIKTCKLNSEDLIRKRKGVMDKLLLQFKRQTLRICTQLQYEDIKSGEPYKRALKSTLELILHEIYHQQNPDQCYSAFGKKMWLDFDGFFLSSLPHPKQRKVVTDALEQMNPQYVMGQF